MRVDQSEIYLLSKSGRIEKRKGLARTAYIIAGILCVTAGVIGIFFPILPTTPFLLLAAYFFARSSERFLHWLLTNRWLGAYIRNYRAGLGMTALSKIFTISALWLSIGSSIAFLVEAWWLKMLLAAIGSGVTYHLLSINTYNPKQAPKVQPHQHEDPEYN